MRKLWAVMGALAAANVAVALVVFVAPGFHALVGGAAADATAARVPGLVSGPPWRPPFLGFITVPRPGGVAVRRDLRTPDQEASDVAPVSATAPEAAVPAARADDAAGLAPGGPTRPQVTSRQRNVAPDGPRRAFGPAPTAPALVTPLGLYPSGYLGAGLALLSFVTFLGLAGTTAFALPARLRVVRLAVTASPRRLAALTALGLLALALAAVVVQVLFMLVVSVVLTPLVVAVVGAAVFFGLVAMLLAVGAAVRSLLHVPAPGPLVDLAVGMLAVFPLTLIPVLGWAVMALLAAAGTGAVIATKFGGTGGWTLSPLSEGQP